jgi:ABC-type sulfate/molybdate transport systems ATPase subunit
VLLLDEPAAALDAAARTAFLDDIDHALADVETTVVHVSHRPEEAVRGADQVAVLDRGRVRQLGPPSDVFAAPADESVARIVGYHNVVPVEVRGDGVVQLSGLDVGFAVGRPTGSAMLAVWATGIDLSAAGHDSGTVCVRSVVPGPGRFEVVLDCRPQLVVHLSVDKSPPRPGDRVKLRLHPGLFTLVASDSSASGS